MIIIILLNLIISTFISYFFGFFIGRKGVFILSIFNMLICFIYANYIFFSMLCSNYVIIATYVKVASWIDLLDFNISWDILLDSLSIAMVFIIVSISFLVHIYSYYYMW